MQFVICLLAIACTSVGFDDWLPPENANPQAILQEARADTRAKRYKTALAKHVWFHENALSIRPSLYGVRLSFALSYWDELAKEYPPALTKMKEFRDQAKKLAADSDFGADHFEFANKQFANDVTTLVAILVVTDRKNEAEDVAKSARAEWDDSSFHEGLDKALEGVVPDPWP